MSSHDKFLELFKNLPYEIKLTILTSFIQISPKKECDEIKYNQNMCYYIRKFFNSEITFHHNAIFPKFTYFGVIIFNDLMKTQYKSYYELMAIMKLASNGYYINSLLVKTSHDGYDCYGAKSYIYNLKINCIKNNINYTFNFCREFWWRDGKDVDAFYDNHNKLLGLPKYHFNTKSKYFLENKGKFENIKIDFDDNLITCKKKNIRKKILKSNYGRL